MTAKLPASFEPYLIPVLADPVRLNCRASENLILTDDVLELLKTDWGKLKNRLEKWLTENDGHAQYPAVLDFKNGGWDRRNADLKPLRVLLLAISGSNKPWEIAVGQAIAGLKRSANTNQNGLRDFLGGIFFGFNSGSSFLDSSDLTHRIDQNFPLHDCVVQTAADLV
jgi:hypothetical protein